VEEYFKKKNTKTVRNLSLFNILNTIFILGGIAGFSFLSAYFPGLSFPARIVCAMLVGLFHHLSMVYIYSILFSLSLSLSLSHINIHSIRCICGMISHIIVILILRVCGVGSVGWVASSLVTPLFYPSSSSSSLFPITQFIEYILK